MAGKGPAECVCRALGKVCSPRPVRWWFWEDDISGITKNYQKQLAQLAQKLALCRLEVVAIRPRGPEPLMCWESQ